MNIDLALTVETNYKHNDRADNSFQGSEFLSWEKLGLSWAKLST